MAGRWLLATLFAIAAPLSAPGQAPQRFEVASVRPNPNPYIRPVLFTPPGSPILITNYTLGALVHFAYGLKSTYEMRGGPAWVMRDRFDISAVPPPGSSEEQVPAMTQQLLAERFRLRVRSDTSPQPVWALVVDRADGRLGPKLTPSVHDCKAFFATGATISSPHNPRCGWPCSLRIGCRPIERRSRNRSDCWRQADRRLCCVSRTVGATGRAHRRQNGTVWHLHGSCELRSYLGARHRHR